MVMLLASPGTKAQESFRVNSTKAMHNVNNKIEKKPNASYLPTTSHN